MLAPLSMKAFWPDPPITLAKLDNKPGSCFATTSLSLLAPCGLETSEISAARRPGTAALIAFWVEDSPRPSAEAMRATMVGPSTSAICEIKLVAMRSLSLDRDSTKAITYKVPSLLPLLMMVNHKQGSTVMALYSGV